jgi:polysaccharide biosynthesis protein PslH
MAETASMARQPAWADPFAGARVSGEILFLAHRVPFPPNRGDKIRSWNVLKALCKIAPVHVCALMDSGDTAEDVAAVKAIAASAYFEPASRSRLGAVVAGAASGTSASVQACSSDALQSHVFRILDERPIAAVYAFSGQMAQFVPTLEGKPRFVMDFVDMDSAKFGAWADAATGPVSWANRIEAKRLFAFEKAIAQRAAISLFVSDAEAELFREKTRLDASQVLALENGIDLSHFDPALDYPAVEAGQGPLAVFTGQMDYAPNVEAVAAFAQDVLPLIHLVEPKAKFAIVGRAPTAEVTALSKLRGLIVTGEVADTRDWLKAADVVVAPLKLARGVQNKVLEAMAMAKPVVASSAAVLGIDATAGRDLLVADSAVEQAAEVLKLLLDKPRAGELGTAARARMVERYSWDATLARLPVLLGMTA